jgi:malate dehydrogenase (oxaloacetate-decarboxylating)
MAIAAAHSLAKYAEKRGIDPENITPTMDEADVFPVEAADVAMQAIKDGVARREVTWDEAYQIAKKDIEYSRSLTHSLCDNGFINDPPQEMLQDALEYTKKQIEG